MSANSSRRGAMRPHGHGAPMSSGHRRVHFPDLSPTARLHVFDPAEQVAEPAAQWPAWTDRRAVETAVDPILWPAWTDARFTEGTEGGES